MARNLGGSLGLSLLGIFIDRRVEGHSDAIRETVTANSPMVQEHIASQAAGFAASGGDMAYGRMQALRALSGTIHPQAMVITYSECFWVLGVALLAMMPLVLLLRPPPRGAPPPTDAH
jgi:DHA2 family multidrug resistance protein